jgi:hypothetical protein
MNTTGLRELNTDDLPEGFETSFDLVGQDENATVVVLEDFEGNILSAADMYGEEIHMIEAIEKRKGYAGTLVRELQDVLGYIKLKKICDECKPFAEAMGFEQIGNSSDWEWEFKQFEEVED